MRDLADKLKILITDDSKLLRKKLRAELEKLDCAGAMERLRRVRGVGEKVANCFILFGLHKMEAFPVDVWMKRALAEHFPKNFDPAVFGDYAGLAQQYIFFYARSGEHQ